MSLYLTDRLDDMLMPQLEMLEYVPGAVVSEQDETFQRHQLRYNNDNMDGFEEISFDNYYTADSNSEDIAFVDEIM